MSEEEQIAKKKLFLDSMRDTMEKYKIPLERFYNADQTGLFFNKLPNRIYIVKEAKDYCGIKKMKSKDRVMLMVATSAVGEKIPLFMVGKAKAAECFRLCGGKQPMHYHYQTNAWFDKSVTLHWINKFYGLGTSNSMATYIAYCYLTTALLTATLILTSFPKSLFFSSSPRIALHFFNRQTWE